MVPWSIGTMPPIVRTSRSLLKRAGKVELVCEAPAPEPSETRAVLHAFVWRALLRSTGECRVRRGACRALARFLRHRSDTQPGVPPRASFEAGSSWASGWRCPKRCCSTSDGGESVNPSLAEYHVPVHLDVPEIDVIFNDIPDPQSAGSVRGLVRSASPARQRLWPTLFTTRRGRGVRELLITLDKLI